MVGNSGSGKTTLGRALAGRLGVDHLELDSVYHRAGWTAAPDPEFRAEVAAWLQARPDGWVVDGNYRALAGVLAPEVHVWLDYPRWVVFPRVLWRTAGRVVLRRELWNGNTERLRSLLSRDREQNILLWSWTQHAVYRQRLRALAAEGHGTWVRLRSPREARAWMSSLPRR